MKKIVVLFSLIIISFHSFANQDAKNFVTVLLEDDIRIFKEGGNSRLKTLIPTVSSSKLIGDYQNNQFKYENDYAGKLVRIKTIASGVKTTLKREPYIVANGKNQLEFVSLFLKDKNDAMNINKGDRIDMICLGTSDNIMFPSLNKCVSTDVYLEQLATLNKNSLDRISQNDKPTTNIEALYLGVSDLENQAPNSLSKYKTVKDIFEDEVFLSKVSELVKKRIDVESTDMKFYYLPTL